MDLPLAASKVIVVLSIKVRFSGQSHLITEQTAPISTTVLTETPETLKRITKLSAGTSTKRKGHEKITGDWYD